MVLATDAERLARSPATLLSKLIAYDTTNPPGNERACVLFIAELLRAASIDTRLLARCDARPNLIARISGNGTAPPLLLYGHADVVTAAGQRWSHPPFAGDIADGCVWGRGALDMKGGLTMMVAACIRLKLSKDLPPGDILLAVVADEEVGEDFGARWLVDNHREEFSGVRYAIGEFGGFSMSVAGRRLYMIQVAEKQKCWLRATVRGGAGHGSVPVRGGAMACAGEVIRRLDRARLPVHVTAASQLMLKRMGVVVPLPLGLVLRALLVPPLTDPLLNLVGGQLAPFDALLHNTVNATAIRGGAMVNVVPSEIELDLDGRLLPGFVPDDILRELRRLVGPKAELEVAAHDPGPSEINLGLFDTLGDALIAEDSGAHPIPLLLSGSTDARFFARLGIQTYGFTPMRLPDELRFTELIHGADERIPIDAIDFGTRVMERVLRRFGDATTADCNIHHLGT